jgi:hypothetical protein
MVLWCYEVTIMIFESSGAGVMVSESDTYGAGE